MEKRTEFGEDVWVIETDTIELCMTRRGGMFAPVSFRDVGDRAGFTVQPYYISHWQGRNLQIDEPVLRPLRGDFFCVPFGAGGEFEGTHVSAHGATATGEWSQPSTVKNPGGVTVTTAIDSDHPAGHVEKVVHLRAGEHVIYTTHTLSGFETPVPVGHHPTLAASDDAPLLISRSPYSHGQVDPANTPVYTGGEYRSLFAGAEFSSLEAVPTVWKNEPVADCTRFPMREGFVDILGTFDVQPGSGMPATPAWTAAVRPEAGYLWFSLKDPTVLPTSLFWMENQGRHQAPWNGRNCCIGLEDICGFFASGLKPSIEQNQLSNKGVCTSVSGPASIHYVQGVCGVPPEFERVQRIEFGENRVAFYDGAGHSVTCSTNWRYALDGEL